MFVERSGPVSVVGFLEAPGNERQLTHQVLHVTLDAVLMTVAQLRHLRFHTLHLVRKSVTRGLKTVFKSPTQWVLGFFGVQPGFLKAQLDGFWGFHGVSVIKMSTARY